MAQDTERMIELLEQLNPLEGNRASLLPDVGLLRTSRSSAPVPVMYEPVIVIVARGRKRLHLPEQTVTYDRRNYLVLTVPVPAECETEVHDDGAFLGVAVRIDLTVLSDLLLLLGPQAVPRAEEQRHRRVGAPPMDPAVSDVTVRLLKCLLSESEAEVLGPQLVRELTYRVLCGEAGAALRSLCLSDRAEMQIHRMLHGMHVGYAAPLRVARLAHDAGMSLSALHFHFKAVTGSSPVQYLKTIRLYKARTLMVQDGVGAAAAAERVGYESASQFSREFKRLFGDSPADHARRVRETFGIGEDSAVAGD